MIAIDPWTTDDLPFGDSLSSAAGWNQVASDWKLLVGDGRGSFVARWNGERAGTVTTRLYGRRLAWVGMVLVHPDFRRRGIATALVEAALDASADCATIALDATDPGRHVYEHLGFRECRRLARFVRPAAPKRGGGAGSDDFARLVGPKDSSAIEAFDGTAFGAPRGDVLRAIVERSPTVSAVAEREGRLLGYGLSRDGRVARHLGPVVAATRDDAEQILRAELGMLSEERAIVDAFLDDPDWVATIERLGFQRERDFVRMVRGDPLPGRGSVQFAAVGPEFG